MAQSYLSRRAASIAQLRGVLLRKLARQFQGLGDEAPDRAAVAGIVEAVLVRVERSGLIDESALAEARAGALMRNGLSSKVVRRKLVHQGLDPDSFSVRETLSARDDDQARRFAERKRLGPFASGRRRASSDRDVRAMVRAGFSPDLALRVLRNLETPEASGASTGVDPDVNAS